MYNLYKRMPHEIDQLRVSKISISLRVIAVFRVKNNRLDATDCCFFGGFFAKCNFHINLMQYNMILLS